MPADKPVDVRLADKDEADAVSDYQTESTRPDDRSDELANGVGSHKDTSAIAVGLAMVLALAGLAGWLGHREHQSNQANLQRAAYVDTARQAAINLTSLSYTEVDADIQRIVDSSMGSFRDNFQQHSPAFVEAIKRIQSTSVGTVTEAGLQSISGDEAQVLVAVSVKTSSVGAPEQETRSWRMRISVTKDGQGAKVSDVQFVE